MNQSVIIKSYPGGLSFHMSEEDNYTDILNEIAGKLEDSRKFFKNAAVAISVEGRILSIDEEKELIQTISEHCDLQVMCLVGKNEDTNRKFIKALKRVEAQKEENNGRFYKGNVTEDMVVESEGSLVIIGNVLPGGTVAATKDIIVLGELAGDAYAGMNSSASHFITALKMEPNICKIGSLTYHAKDKSIFAKKSKIQPYIIYEKNGELVGENILPETFAYVASI